MTKERRIPMEMRQTSKQRSVTFVKRRHGLFNKAANLAILSGAQIAIMVRSISERVKFYSFSSNDSVDAILDPFINGKVPQPLDDAKRNLALHLWHEINTLDDKETDNKETETDNMGISEPWNLAEFEKSNSIEELQALVDELQKLKNELIERLKNDPTSQLLAPNLGNNTAFNNDMIRSIYEFPVSYITDENGSDDTVGNVDVSTTLCTSIQPITSFGYINGGCDVNHHQNLNFADKRNVQEIFGRAFLDTEFGDKQNYGLGISPDQPASVSYMDFSSDGFMDTEFHLLMDDEQRVNGSTENPRLLNVGTDNGNIQAKLNTSDADTKGKLNTSDAHINGNLNTFGARTHGNFNIVTYDADITGNLNNFTLPARFEDWLNADDWLWSLH